jgi:hypothetical protein
VLTAGQRRLCSSVLAVALAGCWHDHATPAPAAPAGLPVACAAAELAPIAKQLGDPAPTFRDDIEHARRTVEATCPTELDDAACVTYARKHVAHAAGEEVGDATIDAAAYVVAFTLEVDGKREAGVVRREVEITERVKQLEADGHQVVPVGVERITDPDARANRTVHVSLRGAPVRRRAHMHVQIQKPSLANIARLMETLGRVAAIERWEADEQHLRVDVTCLDR